MDFRWAHRVNLIAGAWLFISPRVLDFSGDQPAAWNALIFGAIVFVLALWGLAYPRYPRPVAIEWFNIAVGVWIFVSPWVLAFSGHSSAAWDQWLVGIVVTLIAALVYFQMGRTESRGERT